MAATWLIVTGFTLLVGGFVMRTVQMMRSSDAMAPGSRPLYGRELLREYRRQFPRSLAPLLTRTMLACGAVLLLAGLGVQFSR